MLNDAGTTEFGRFILGDITKTIKIVPILEKRYQKTIYFEHVIRNWKGPEDLAWDWYGNVKYTWLILLVNNIIDPFTDWLLTVEELEVLGIAKYGSLNKLLDGIHHWYDADADMTYTSIHQNTKPVTNWAYEFTENEKRRTVRLVKLEFLNDVLTFIKTALTSDRYLNLTGKYGPIKVIGGGI